MNTIHFMGYSAEHPEDFVYDFPLEDGYLLLLTSTPAEFLVDEHLQEYPANSAILYAPGQKFITKPVVKFTAMTGFAFPPLRPL